MTPTGLRRDKRRGIFEPKINPWIAHVLERVWYVLIPLVGVWVAEANFLKPNLTEIRNAGIIERLKNESAGRKLLNEMNSLESVIRAATFERDSVLAPAIARRVFMVDSLDAIGDADREQVRLVKATIDSLAAVIGVLEREQRAFEDSLLALRAQKTDLEAEVLAANDSLAVVRARVSETWSRVNAVKAASEARRSGGSKTQG